MACALKTLTGMLPAALILAHVGNGALSPLPNPSYAACICSVACTLGKPGWHVACCYGTVTAEKLPPLARATTLSHSQQLLSYLQCSMCPEEANRHAACCHDASSGGTTTPTVLFGLYAAWYKHSSQLNTLLLLSAAAASADGGDDVQTMLCLVQAWHVS